MIALILLVGIAVWLVVALLLALWLPSLFGIKRNGWLASALLFPILVVLPIADELIGRWQFKALCEREAIIILSPDWRGVSRAQGPVEEKINLTGYAVNIQKLRQKYLNADDGKEFLEINWLFRDWGGLGRLLGVDSFASMSCSPPDRSQVLKMVNIDQLFGKGR